MFSTSYCSSLLISMGGEGVGDSFTMESIQYDDVLITSHRRHCEVGSWREVRLTYMYELILSW